MVLYKAKVEGIRSSSSLPWGSLPHVLTARAHDFARYPCRWSLHRLTRHLALRTFARSLARRSPSTAPGWRYPTAPCPATGNSPRSPTPLYKERFPQSHRLTQRPGVCYRARSRCRDRSGAGGHCFHRQHRLFARGPGCLDGDGGRHRLSVPDHQCLCSVSVNHSGIPQRPAHRQRWSTWPQVVLAVRSILLLAQ